MGMGNRQPLFQGRYNNEPSGLALTSQANQLEAPSRVSPTQFDPSQLRMGGGKGGYNPSRPVQPQPQPQPQTPPRFDPSQFRMGGGKGGYLPLAANPNMPAPNQNIDIDNSSRQANVDFMNKMAQENALEGGMSPAYSYDPQTGQYARDSSSFGLTGDAATTYYSPQEFQSQFGRALGKMPSNQAAMPSAPIENTRADPPVLDDPAPPTPEPTPEPYVPYVRPRPTRGLFSDQSGIASLRGQYRAPSMSNPQFQPYRPVQRYQPPQRMPRPPQRMPSPYMPSPRMPSPYGQPPRGGPSKGGRQSPPFNSPYGTPRMPSPRMPSPYGQPPRGGPTKGGRQDPQYATLTGRSQPTIPFNPPYGG